MPRFLVVATGDRDIAVHQIFFFFFCVATAVPRFLGVAVKRVTEVFAVPRCCVLVDVLTHALGLSESLENAHTICRGSGKRTLSRPFLVKRVFFFLEMREEEGGF